MKIIGVCFTFIFLMACGQEGTDRNPSLADAGSEDSRGPGMIVDDGGTGDVDAQTHTVCGEGPNSTRCEFNLEVCRVISQGGTLTPECVPLPEHCDSDLRECDRCGGACVAPQESCVDDPAANTVVCM